jgi:hypothetical protein
VVAGKSEFKFFLPKNPFLNPFFLYIPKTLVKHFRNRGRPVNGLKKPKKKTFQNQNQPKTINQPSSYIFFS